MICSKNYRYQGSSYIKGTDYTLKHDEMIAHEQHVGCALYERKEASAPKTKEKSEAKKDEQTGQK